jgi:hypothetical protein
MSMKDAQYKSVVDGLFKTTTPLEAPPSSGTAKVWQEIVASERRMGDAWKRRYEEAQAENQRLREQLAAQKQEKHL